MYQQLTVISVQALVNKQREQHEQLTHRRDAAMHKVEKLVEHHMRSNACVTYVGRVPLHSCAAFPDQLESLFRHEVALAVSQQSRALLESKTTKAARECAYSVLEQIDGVQAELKSLRTKLGGQPA